MKTHLAKFWGAQKKDLTNKMGRGYISQRYEIIAL
jgi:hypothetical protein